MNQTIPKAAPKGILQAYGHVGDLCDAVGAIRVAATSELHELGGLLPDTAIAKLIEAHQALMASHREIEEALLLSRQGAAL